MNMLSTRWQVELRDPPPQSLSPSKLLMSFPSNHVLFCWELPPGASHLPTSFLPPCQGNAVTCSHNALQLPSVRKQCRGAVSIWHFLKKKQQNQNESEMNLYCEMLYVNADRRRGSWGASNVEVSGASADTFRQFKLTFEDIGGARFHMQTCTDRDLKLTEK